MGLVIMWNRWRVIILVRKQWISIMIVVLFILAVSTGHFRINEDVDEPLNLSMSRIDLPDFLSLI